MLEGLSWEAICDQAAGPVAIFDQQGRYVYVNTAFCGLVGYSREEILQRDRRQLTHPDDHALDLEAITAAFASGGDQAFLEKRFVRSDGTVIWVLVNLSIIRDRDGHQQVFLSQIHDITDRHLSERRWHETFANAPNGMALFDLDGNWTEVNDALCDLLGFTRDELLSRRVEDLTYPSDRKPGTVLRPLVDSHEDSVTLERRYRHSDGHPLWVLLRVNLVRGADDEPAYLVGQYEEIGNRRMDDAHLAHMALHDPLTGLANRALLTDRLRSRLAELPRDQTALAVLVVDLDGLKPVNDHYGHLTGDQLLVAAADELLSAVRAGDTVGRLGGDEFVVISAVEATSGPEALRDRVTRGLDTELEVPGAHIRLRASVGLAVTRDPETSPEALIDAADRDMYQHKRRQPRQP